MYRMTTILNAEAPCNAVINTNAKTRSKVSRRLLRISPSVGFSLGEGLALALWLVAVALG